MDENLTILKKGLLLVAVPFLFQIGFIAVLFKTKADGLAAQQWALHSKEVIAKAEGSFRKIVEAQSDLRALILSRHQVFNEHAAKNSQAAVREVDELVQLVSDNPSQRSKAGEVAERTRSLIAWQERMAGLVNQGRQEEAVFEVRELRGKKLQDEVRAALDRFLVEESRLGAERTAFLETTSRREAWALALGALLSTAGVIILAMAFARGITRRLSVLAENASRLAEGKELAQPLSGRDEITKVDRVFHEMARTIDEKNRENEMFIYSVSHDLRSPLVNLQGFSQELGHAASELRGIVEAADLSERTRERFLTLVDEEIGGSIHYIQTAVSRLSSIIDALLRLSRAGRVEYRWQYVDLGTIIGRIVEAMSSTINERGVKITAGRMPAAWGDPTAIEQIFANLIGNAVIYMDPTRPGMIEVGALDGASAALQTYFVKDNGSGIPGVAMAKLFQAFQRFHPGAPRGEGIGLAMVRRIVERHGGRIRVESEPGVGSTFFVDLPSMPDGPTVDLRSSPSFDEKGGRFV